LSLLACYQVDVDSYYKNEKPASNLMQAFFIS